MLDSFDVLKSDGFVEMSSGRVGLQHLDMNGSNAEIISSQFAARFEEGSTVTEAPGDVGSQVATPLG